MPLQITAELHAKKGYYFKYSLPILHILFLYFIFYIYTKHFITKYLYNKEF